MVLVAGSPEGAASFCHRLDVLKGPSSPRERSGERHLRGRFRRLSALHAVVHASEDPGALLYEATLLFPSKEIVEQYYVPLIYTACRTCYSELEPQDIFRKATAGEIDQAKMQRLISNVIESGHGSTIEHVVFTFGISGVSRTLSHQLVRHRAGVAFDQQSQRYVTYKRAATMEPQTIVDGAPELRERYEEQVGGSMSLYEDLVAGGIPAEDARFVFPNATRTNLVMRTKIGLATNVPLPSCPNWFEPAAKTLLSVSITTV